MGKYKYKTIDVNDVPTMAELLENRQSLEGEVYPFLNNSCLNAEHITDMYGYHMKGWQSERINPLSLLENYMQRFQWYG